MAVAILLSFEPPRDGLQAIYTEQSDANSISRDAEFILL